MEVALPPLLARVPVAVELGGRDSEAEMAAELVAIELRAGGRGSTASAL